MISKNKQDVKFAMRMIPHHEAAVQMALDEIESGQNEEMKAAARDIYKAQMAEINKFRKWLKSVGGREDANGTMKM